MRSPVSIIAKNASGLCIAVLLALGSALPAIGQKVAVMTPVQTPLATAYSARLSNALTTHFNILDRDMADAAFRSVSINDPFNLSVEASKNIGAVTGCDYFLLLRTGTLRRVSLNRPDYFEAFAATYVVSAKTGRLVIWKLKKAEAETGDKAEERLLPSADVLANEISNELPKVANAESTETEPQPLEEVPADDTPAAKNFRAPVPYRRIAPENSTLAYLYDIRATVEIRVDLDADGKILRTEIVRWAGFGLDEAVDAAVRKMNWRPATRSSRTLPIRFFLRYNFKKIEKE